MRANFDPTHDVKIIGNTYPVREALEHTFQGFWDKGQKCWWVPTEHAEAAQKMVDTLAPEDALDQLPIIEGKTFPVKAALRSLGARWDGNNKVWRIAPARLAEAQKIVNDQPAPETKTCWECGREFTYAECRKADGDWSDSYCGC